VLSAEGELRPPFWTHSRDLCSVQHSKPTSGVLAAAARMPHFWLERARTSWRQLLRT